MLRVKDLGQKELEVLVNYVRGLRNYGLSYSEIVERVYMEKGVKISKATVLRWCKEKHEPFNKIKLLDLSPSPALSYILGAYFGDVTIGIGQKYKYRIRLKVVDREFTEAFAKALKEIGANPRVGYENDSTRVGRWYVESTTKSLYMFLK
ncbi:hypothetical protein OCC_13900 [Thermococcus litoralis DSM 5473]|uniref:DOD-type homing endonuclease domain-containing protein n=1 Tax=Thermococcus litoralis (strain ATCC 51850 / DSM 5473 / JCM 8560 / NS-C) TaxID=523849 RepID=S5ZB20_THELN|nr:hypothetical protein [Thermococcus litoralis]AGT34263.1 hypothetical protein OCC_13900 [Thermococcus litoralis DSM 5473]